MKVFFDTNILLEILLQRERRAEAKQLLELFSEGLIAVSVSQASYYTLAYVLEQYLRKEKKVQGKAERLMLIRDILNEITILAESTSIHNSQIKTAINDDRMQDIEDSLQLQNAIAEGCEYLLTFNVSDFPTATEDRIKILTPAEFINTIKT